MSKKHFIRYFFWIMIAFFLGGAILSCKESKVDLEEVSVVDLQIHRFYLSSKKNPDLAKIFFSIDHVNGTIVNKKSIPYGTVLDSVLMNLVTDFSAKKLRVAINDGEYKDWHNKDSLWLRDCHTLHLMVLDESGEKTKKYTVTLNRYDYHPSTFVWNMFDGASLPDLNASYTDMVTSGDKVYLVVTIGDKTVLYSSDRKNPIHWSLLPSSGLSGACRQIAVADDGRAFILTDSGIYHSDDLKNWNLLPSEVRVTSLLGAMAWPQGRYTLALLAEKDGSLFFATNVDGVHSWQEQAPKTFPVRNFSTQLYKANNHPMLRLVGGVTRAGAPADSVWITSNGNDWFGLDLPAGAIPASMGKGALVQTPSDGNLYYYATEQAEGVKRVAVAYSTDKGITWKRGAADIMLPADPFYTASYPLPFVCAFDDGAYNIYQLGGVSSSGTFFSTIWKGILKLNENN
ncbi:DUF6242 domain-containing protein [Porphyromonas gulae]|uniref:DUF6242 domain-containing protein n=1 Tax=Porphyromonas gulae TaxID=111105 RepID=UPI0026ED8EBA|nr:DUF6242 domain-containing protein [Porphyromonas gulae]